jgi:hypothetical protein
MLISDAASLWTHAIFLVLVAGAVYAQALTGFALALILLGVIGATNLVPLTDAVDASMVIGFCTAWTFLYRRRALHIEPVLFPLLATSVVGIVAGAVLLFWLAGTAYQVLRLLLGASIVACALSLWAPPGRCRRCRRPWCLRSPAALPVCWRACSPRQARLWSTCCIGSRSPPRGSVTR